jgi:hypothetical protein
MVRIITALLVLVLDPLAVLLTLAAGVTVSQDESGRLADELAPWKSHKPWKKGSQQLGE